jgi:hypothetical protein
LQENDAAKVETSIFRAASYSIAMNPKILLAFVGGAAAAGVISLLVISRSDAPKAPEAPVAVSQPVVTESPVAKDVAPEPVVSAPVAPAPVGGFTRKPAKPSASVKPAAPVVVAQSKPAPTPAPAAVESKPEPVTLPPFSSGSSAPPPPPKAEEPKRTEIFKPEPPKAPARTPETITLPAGTSIVVRVNSTLSSDKNLAGDTFTGTLDQPIVVNDMVIAERGARVDGKVVESTKAGRVKGTSLLSVALTRIRTSDGQNISISTDPFVREGESSKKADAVKVGVGAAIGAAIGAIAGGGKGAGVGAASGGAAGGGVVLATRGKPVQIDVETKVPFRLANSVSITEKIN